MDAYVINSSRGLGRTPGIIEEIQAALGARESVLVVCHSGPDIEEFMAIWNDRLPYYARPEYMSMNNRIRAYGRRFDRVYVEDVEFLDGGIYDPYIMQDILPSVQKSITFTAAPTELSQRSHVIPPPSEAVEEAAVNLKRRFLRWKRG